MKRSRAITLALVPSLAMFLTACGRDRRVCVDQGQTVIDPQYCASGGAVPPLGHWYYPSSGGFYPLGSRMGSGSGGSSSSASPSGTVRGGIGASGESHSSGSPSGGAGE